MCTYKDIKYNFHIITIEEHKTGILIFWGIFLFPESKKTFRKSEELL